MLQLVFQILLAVVAIFLILLVLVQRGRGGGLAGALGGMGGSSAFGAKAGDIFTRITVVAAAFWILLCVAAAKLGPSTAGSRLDVGNDSSVSTEPALTAPVTTEGDADDESAAQSGASQANEAPTTGEPPSAGTTTPAESQPAAQNESANPIE